MIEISDETYKEMFNGNVDPQVGDVYKYDDTIHNTYDSKEHYVVVTQVSKNGAFRVMSLPERMEKTVYKVNWVGCKEDCGCLKYAFSFPNNHIKMMDIVVDMAREK